MIASFHPWTFILARKPPVEVGVDVPNATLMVIEPSDAWAFRSSQAPGASPREASAHHLPSNAPDATARDRLKIIYGTKMLKSRATLCASATR